MNRLVSLTMLLLGACGVCALMSANHIGSAVAADAPSAVDKVVQPDYSKWRRIKKGMDEGDVIDLLGEPLAKPDYEARKTEIVYSWDYGYLTPKSVVFPIPLRFMIRFQHGKVFTIEDPFNGKFSRDGTPTIPDPIWTDFPPVYRHYPRWIDLRWYPAAGTYPMRYEVEIGLLVSQGNAVVANDWRTIVLASDIPFVSSEFEAQGHGRWRVRAINEKGIGDWSDYRTFEFTR